MNGRPGPLSSSSNEGGEGSAYSRYRGARPQDQQPPYSPTLANNRGNLVTPPMSGSSNGAPRMSTMSTGMSNRPGEPSPPHSVARSSFGTNYSSSENHRRQAARMEERLSQHYHILKRFLAQSLHDEKTSAKPNRARDKLLRLSSIQFQELSTDVYDELQRRQSASVQQNGPNQIPAYLLPRENFHPKRNQARQKLATLPPPRFRDLATDVFYELERRFPHFAGSNINRQGSPGMYGQGPPSRGTTPNGMRPPRNASLGGQVMAGLGIPGIGSEDEYGRPTAKTFQSNTIIPNKSTMVEDDDDDGMSDVYGGRRDTTYTSRSGAGKANPEHETQINDLQEKIKGLEEQVGGKDSELRELKASHGEQESTTRVERQQWDGLRSDLERSLKDARNLNDQLRSQLDSLHDDKQRTERELHSELESLHDDRQRSERELRSQLETVTSRSSGDNEWKKRYETLDKSHRDLQTELVRQERTTTEVKNEAASFVSQLKGLSQRTDYSVQREDELTRRVQQLESEAGEWKSRYAKAKTQVRNARPGSVTLPASDTRRLAQQADFSAPDGKVKDLLVTRFQISVDELLHTARAEDASEVLSRVKSVVTAVRNISLAVGNDAMFQGQDREQLSNLKAKVSATTNNLITAAKNFAFSKGLLPVSLLDAAASHVSIALVGVLRIVKIRPTPPSELEHEDDGNSIIADSPADYYGFSHTRTTTRDESVYESSQDPQPNLGTIPAKTYSPNALSNGNSITHQPPMADNSKIESLKNFLDTRTTTLLTGIQTLVSSIRASAPPPEILDTIVTITSTTSQIINQAYTCVPEGSAAESIVARLADDVEKMEQKGRDGEEVQNEKDWNIYVKGLPPLAFEIAREVKELGAWVDGETGAGDFS